MKRLKNSSYCKCAFAIICLLAGISAAEELTLNINVKKPIAIVSEKFLSITLDPVALFSTNFLSDVEKSTNMARALAPAYVRIAGPRSNSYVFERGMYPQQTHPDPGLTITETHWINLHQWAERSGLDVLACIAPQMSEGARAWDPRNALDLISFSDHMGYNTSWQLGYECQTNCKASGAELGRDVARLRSMLDAFPRFAETGLVAGPDVVTWRTKQEQQYLQDYFNAAAAGLSALTWHPDFAGVSLEEDGVSMHYDNLASERDALYKVVGRQVSKKPLWIAESKPEDCKRQFLGALVWARRLGNSAKLGVQVLMRQPENSNLLRPTPDFWVSMLHKMLVGREVLDTKISSGNRTHIHFYTQCTRPSSKYERGSIVIFGINLTPSKVAATLKGLKTKTVHKYVLLPGYDSPNRMFAETVLLNNDLLSLINGKQVPEINPITYSVDKDVKLKLPSGGIGFWVLPGLKIKSCMGPEDDIGDRNIVRKANRRLEDVEVEEDLEPVDDNSREAPDVADSLEERKSLLRHQVQRRIPERRSVRHKETDRDDERSSTRRGVGIKRDVRRYEIHGSKKGRYDDFESAVCASSDEKDENFGEAVERKILDGQPLDSGEEIRAKLHEYKRRLADHEYRKKQRGKAAAALTKDRPAGRDEPDKNMDTGKVIEALTLITKVENAMKDFEKNNGTQQRLSPSPILGSDDSSVASSGSKRSTKNDELLDEVLNTEKAKRTTVPSKIEDQLKALYKLLSEEKDKKSASLPLRPRRDLDKRIGDDPLGLRRDSVLLRKRTEAKERRNERRQRIRERLGEHRRERENARKAPRETSNENNFYGFQYRAPLKNFPEGDMYVQATMPPAEQANNPTKAERATDEHQDVWLEEGDGNHMPNEFYENVKMQGYNAKENLKEYGELWEAESLNKNEDNLKSVNGAAEYATPEIVTERQLTEAEDRRAKEQAVQQLINYYQTAPQEQSYDFEELRLKHVQGQQQQIPQVAHVQQPQPQMYYQPQVPVNYHQAAVPAVKYVNYPGTQSKYPDANQYYIDPSQYLQQQNRRSRRDISDLEDLLHQEMIDEDDNNLKDCQCRVIRGTENCKDCHNQKTRQEPTPPLVPGQFIQNPDAPIYEQRLRVRRDTDEIAPAAVAPEVMPVIPEGIPGLPETIINTPGVVEPEVRVEEEIDETIAPAAPEQDADPVSLETEAPKDDTGSSGPVKFAMNLEAEEGEPLGSRVTRKTGDTANKTKFFRKKGRVTTTTTTAAPAKTAEQETTGTESATAEAESAGEKTDDKRAKATRSSGEGNVEAAVNPNQPSFVTFVGEASGQPFNPAIENQALTGGFANPASQPISTAYNNQASVAAISGATDDSPGPFVGAANQTPTIAFTGSANKASFTRLAGPPNQPFPVAFINANAGSTVTIRTDKLGAKISDSVAKPKAYDPTANKAGKLVVKTADATVGRKDQFDTRAGVVLSNGANKPLAETNDAIAKWQSTPNDANANFKQTPADQIAGSTILKNPTTPKSEITAPLLAKKSTAPPKTNSSTAKLDDLIKARHARLTTRSEALAALRKENENRRAKKMIEASLKLLESESARFAEYEKRRRDQLDKLKDKLRAKREKMLSQYKEELIEAINDSDQKQRNLHRRHLLDDDSGYANHEYGPIVHHHDDDFDSDECEESKHSKRSSMATLYQPMDDDEDLYDTSPSEFRAANFKRSPMVVVDYNNQNNKPQVMEGDSGEYYTPEQQHMLQQRVSEAQKRLQQHRQPQHQHRREDLMNRQQHVAGQEYYQQAQQPYPPQGQQAYPTHVQQPYPPRMQQPYQPQMQQPYPPQAQQLYPTQTQTPYPPQQPYPPAAQGYQAPGPHRSQQRHPAQHYSQAQHNGKNAVHLNMQYSQPPPQALPQQQPAYPASPVSPQHPGVVMPVTDPRRHPQQSVVPQQQQPFAQQPNTELYHQSPVQPQQPFVQAPNAELYNQQSPVQPQQPFAQPPNAELYNQQPAVQPQQQPADDYYRQDRAVAPQQPDNSQQQQAGVDYTYHQASVSQQQQLQPEQQQQQQQQQQQLQQQQYPAEYYSQPQTAAQQYYYPAAATAQQGAETANYYEQPSTTSQQQTDMDSNDDSESTQHVTSGVTELAAVSQIANPQPQPAVAYQTTAYTAAVDQSQPQPIADAHLYEQKMENAENLQELKVYQPAPPAEESAPAQQYDYHQYYQQQQPQVNPYEVNPAAYQNGQGQSPARAYKKSKRSNFKFVEINPAIYEDDDSDYNLHELFMKPSSRFSSRTYRSSPTDNKRYRRGTELDDKEDGPLSIPLGLDLSSMVQSESSAASPDTFTRRKRQAEDSKVSSLNKNVKKTKKSNCYGKHKKAPRRLTQLKRVNDTAKTVPRVRRLRIVTVPMNYFPPVEDLPNNHLDEYKDKDALLTRRRRSPSPKYETHVRYNRVDRNEDSDINEIWNDIIEMKQDEALDEYDRRKEELFTDFIKDQKPDALMINDDDKDSAIQKVAESTTKANIESMIVDAIPKLENVITGGIEKAQNLTGNLEDFIEKFDEQFDETTENVQETSESPEYTSSTGGRLTHSVFKTMIGGVKKFFGFISGITNIFHKH